MKNMFDWSQTLCDWYRTAKRDLPWRRTRDPYAIWISEIMLQQTRVETVKEYYERFMMQFPNIAALATATEESVLKCWEGLGYYSRARNLQSAARRIMTEWNGQFPHTLAELRSLPGIGPYTAGAIASLAFDEPAPAIDGNVKRVAARLFGIRENIEASSSEHLVQQHIQDALQRNEPAVLNQALMELGALLCTPRSPRCAECPLQQGCDALAEGDAEMLPIQAKKKPAREIEVAVCILTFQDTVLMTMRNERLLKGLYVFWLNEDITDAEGIRAHLEEEGLLAAFVSSMGEAKHVFTHRIWRMKLLHYQLTQAPHAEWLASHQSLMATADKLRSLPLPTAMKAAKAAALVLLAQGIEESRCF